MGFFDFLDDALDGLIELPGKILEAGAETVIRLPEIPIKAVEGLAKGVEKGAEKLGDAIDGI